MDKRGVSTLIAVVLLILITVGVVGIVWQIIIPLAKQSTEVTEKCQAVSFEINKKSFYNASSGQASILLSRGAPVIGTETAELSAIQIKITSDTGDSKTVKINASQTALPKVNEDKLYVINLGGLTGSSFKAEVAPVVEVNEKERLCQMTAKYPLQYVGVPLPSQTCLFMCCANNEMCIGTDLGTTSDCSTKCCDGTCCIDFDLDTYANESCGGTDCNDTNPDIHPGANETCGNEIDEDCDDEDLTCSACPEGQITTRCDCGGVIYESGYCCLGVYQTDPCTLPPAYYVDNSGTCDDGGPGTEANPWCDIDQAASTMVAGETVYVKAGTYTGFAISTSGTAGNYISYFAYPGDTVITGEIWFANAASYIRVDGFNPSKINMITVNSYNIISNNRIISNNDPGGCMNFEGVGHIIEGNEFCCSGAHGLHHGLEGINTIIRNNIFHDNDLHGWGAVGGKNESVINNTFYNNGRTGLFYCTASPENITIEGNLAFNNNRQGIDSYYSEICVKGPGAIVRGNTAYTPITSISTYSYNFIEASGVIVENNIGYRTGAGRSVAHIISSAITDYNDWFNPDEPACIRRGWDTPITLAEYQTYGQGQNSISQDPVFVDIANNDFHPITGSPVCTMSETGSYIGALPCV